MATPTFTGHTLSNNLKILWNPINPPLPVTRQSKKLDHEDTDGGAQDQPDSTNSHLSKCHQYTNSRSLLQDILRVDLTLIMKLLTMMFVAVCCSSFLTLVFTPTITTLKQKVEIKWTQAFASPGKNSSGDAEDQHEDDVDNIRMDKDGGEEALAGHEIADEEEGEGERP